MSKPRQTQHFAEIEYCLQNYFNSQLAPVMKEAQTYLTQKQVEEIGAYHASTAGVLRSLANGANGMPDDSLPYLRQTGEWNSKTTGTDSRHPGNRGRPEPACRRVAQCRCSGNR